MLSVAVVGTLTLQVNKLVLGTFHPEIIPVLMTADEMAYLTSSMLGCGFESHPKLHNFPSRRSSTPRIMDSITLQFFHIFLVQMPQRCR